ncbi:MAG TPA: ABC transporter permease [Actinomycetota bacterium]
MSGLAVLVGKELLEARRTLRLQVVAGLFLIVGIGSPLIARYTPEIVEALAGDMGIPIPTPSPSDAVDQLLKNLVQFGGLAAILLAMGSVATEKERGTAALILTKPVDRAAFLVAKLVTLAATLALATALATAGAWLYTMILFEQPSAVGYAASGVLTWLSLVAYAAVTFLASTLTRSALVAAAVGFGAFVALGIASAFPTVGEYLPPGLGVPARALALGEAADPLLPLVSTLVLIVACAVGAWASFRRQEL